MKELYIKLITGALLLGLAFAGGVFVSCKSLSIKTIKGQPQACNDMYTFTDAALQTNNFTMVAYWTDKCIEARKYQKEKDCEKWIYQGEKIDPKDYKKKSYLLECKK